MIDILMVIGAIVLFVITFVIGDIIVKNRKKEPKISDKIYPLF